MTAQPIVAPPPPRVRLPRWAFVAMALTAVASFIGGHNGGAVWTALWAPGIGAAFVLSMALEARVASLVPARRTALRALVLAFAVVIGFVASSFLWALRPVFLIFGFDAGVVVELELFALWFLAATLGGLPVLVVDMLASWVFPGFRRRLEVVVLSVSALAAGLAIVVLITGISLVDAAKTGQPHPLLGDHVAGFDVSREQFERSILPYIDSPAATVLLAALVAALYGAPALLSAVRKLADSVVDDIAPFTLAFERVSHGARDVVVVEHGPRELKQLARDFNAMLQALTTSERMERAFGQYVSSHVFDLIRAQHGEGNLPAALRDASVFFADIRGFTAMSERLQPAEVVALLNRYFERVVPVIHAHDGYLNKFIGDAVVVVFNGPIDQADHPARATRCAIELQKTVAEMNAANAFPEIGALQVGVGIASGPMVCGNVGGMKQVEYTVIGDTVNLAARLTSKAGPGEVWLSANTARGLPSELPAEALPLIEVKGKTEKVMPYRAWPLP